MHVRLRFFNTPFFPERKRHRATVFLILFFLFCLHTASAAEESPYRSFFPNLHTISTQELGQNYHSITLIDVRSRFEFDVVHIASSINRPLADGSFTREIQNMRGSGKNGQVVIVGNDSQSPLAFEAANIARLHGYTNISVYEAGVFAWLHAFPEKTRLLGDSPADIEQTVPLVEHQLRLMPFPAFQQIAKDPEAVVIDIRNIFHRRLIPAGMPVRHISFDALLEAVDNRVWAEKRLLIFDSDGGRTRWLQVFLQAGGYYDFSFLNGGINSLAAEHLKRIDSASGERASVGQAELREALLQLRNVVFADTVLLYVLSKIRSENLAFIDLAELTGELDISRKGLSDVLEEMMHLNLVRFAVMDDTLICLIEPGLVWKGDRSGSGWQRSMRQFYNE